MEREAARACSRLSDATAFSESTSRLASHNRSLVAKSAARDHAPTSNATHAAHAIAIDARPVRGNVEKTAHRSHGDAR